jgi:hypothetical protein
MDPLTRWVHLLALAVYLGTTLAVPSVLLPAAEGVADPTLQRRVLARGLRLYNVLSVGALGVLVISGASGLTDYKAMLGADFGRLLWRLVGKLCSPSSSSWRRRTSRSASRTASCVPTSGSCRSEPEKQAGMIRRMRSARGSASRSPRGRPGSASA